MRINLPWQKMPIEERNLWIKFLNNYGYEMSQEELNFLEQSYIKWTGSEGFDIKNLMMFGNVQEEEQAANDLFGISKF